MYSTIKRILDIVFSSLALVILAAPLLLLMALIRLDSPGAPVFAQKRIGRQSRPFTIYKLRTMKISAPRSVATGELDDPKAHITRLGAFLRKTSLDELPQFFNILRGDMSIVGPRPLVPEEESVHAERREKGVYAVRPGITGWAQINGRDLVNAGMKADMDAYYAQHMSFGLDAKIFIKTVAYVLTARGIQEGAPQAREEGSDAQADDH